MPDPHAMLLWGPMCAELQRRGGQRLWPAVRVSHQLPLPAGQQAVGPRPAV
jgi:hypothetical protein